MDFFKAQKTLITLWFIWGLLLMLYIGYHIIFGNYKDVDSSKLITWIATYLASIFSLIMGSSFFSKDLFNEKLKDNLYFYLAVGASVLYLLFISITLVNVPNNSECGEKCFEIYLLSLDKIGKLLNFILPVLTALLGYFFYKNKKQEPS